MTRRPGRIGVAMAMATLQGALMMAGTALAQAAPDWPPALKPLPDNFGYREPAQSMETFTLPPGYDIELVASEPLLGDGIVMQWDYQGRLWVVETTFMLNFEDLTSAEPSSSIVILEDTDGDGVMDKRTAFAEDLVLPRALLILEPGKALVGESPNIWLMEDTDGDDVADTKVALTENNYGGFGGSIEHNPNGMFWNIDNRIYNAYLDEVYRWNGEGLDTERGISIAQWGIAADDQGRILRQGNSAAPSMSLVPDHYYGRSTVFTRNRGNHEWIGGPTRAANRVWPARPTPGINRAYVDGILDENGAMIELTAAGGLGVYRGTALSPSDYGNVIVPEPAGNLLTMSTLHDTGSGQYLRKAYERGDFVTSTEERFRPVLTQSGPDGAMYVLDLYHGVIQDAVFMSNYLRDWSEQHDLQKTHGANGRVYRITHEDGTPSEVMDLTQMSPAELVALLEHDNGWHRDHAQRLIVAQQKSDAAGPLSELLASDAGDVARLHALWTLNGLGALTPDQVVAALDDPNADIQAAALRVAEPFLAGGDGPVTEAVMAMIGNTSNMWQVQYQLAASVGEMAEGSRLDAIQRVIDVYGADYIALDAALSGVPDDQVGEMLDRLFAVETGSAGIRNAITTIATGITTVGSADEVQAMLDAIAAEDRPAWQREAALLGMEIVLAGVADPGLAPALPPSDTGSWSVGDLGERAFADFNAEVNAADAEQKALLAEQRAANAPARPESALLDEDGVPILTLNSEPAAFLELAQDEALAGRIDGLTALMMWPDGEAAEATNEG